MKVKLLVVLLLSLLIGGASLNIAHADTALISGTVDDSSGTPIVGAAVSVNDANGDNTITSSSGSYSLSVPSGTYNVEVTPPAGDNFSSAVAYSVTVTTSNTLNFILTQAGSETLSGHIYDENGNPIAGQHIYLGSNVAVTDASGNYSFTASSGTYSMDIDNGLAYNHLSNNVPGAYDLSFSGYSLTQDTIQNFTLPGRQVSVHVQGGSNNPVSGVALTTSGGPTNGVDVGGYTANGFDAYSTSNGPVPTTDANGNATLWLFPGSYSITATPASGSVYAATTVSNITVTSDMSQGISLQQPVTLSGHVYDENGNPVAGQHVYLGSNSSVTDASGSYSVMAVPGVYSVDIDNGGAYGNLSRDIPGEYDLGFGGYILAQDTTQDFTLPGKQVSVRVQDGSGNPVSGVALTTSGGPTNGVDVGGGYTANGFDGFFTGYNSPTTDANGNATLWLFPGSYSITATPASGSAYVATSVSGITVSSDMSQSITLQQPVTLSGHIYDENGNPVARQQISLGSATTTTDSNGSYSFTVAPGTYQVGLDNGGDYGDLSHDVPGEYDINLSPGYTLTQNSTQDFTLPAKQVSVHVQDGSGNPVSDVVLNASGSLSGVTVGSYSASGFGDYNTGYNSPTTDADGNATFWLFEGDYTVTATPPSGSIYSQFNLNNVSVTGDQSELVSLQYSHNSPVTIATLSPSPYSDGGYSDPVTVSLLATDLSGYSVANTYYTVDGGAQQTYTEPFTVTGSGNHTITYWSVDSSGVIETANSQSFTIESVPSAPTNLTATSPTQNPSLSWSAVSGASSYNIYRNNTKIDSTTSTTYTDNNAPEGSDSYYVTAVNGAGESGQSNSVNVLVDRTAPTITYSVSPSPNSAGWNNSPTTITYGCTDNTGGSGVASYSSPQTESNDGQYTLTGYCTDNAGNTSSVNVTVNLDQTPPTLGVPTWSTNPVISGNNSTLTVTSSDSLSGVSNGEYYIGSTDPGQGNGTPMTYNGSTGSLSASLGTSLTPGTYNVNIRAEDAAGNWSSVTTTTLTVNPSTPAAPTNLTASTPTQNPVLSWTGSTYATSYNIYRNGTKIGSSTNTTYTDSSAPEGTDSYYVTAVNGAGESTSSNTINVLVDRTAPTITYVVSPAPNGAGWNNSSTTVTYSCTDNSGGSGVASYTLPQTESIDGQYTLTGTCTDKAGNTASVNVPVNLDQTAPTLGTPSWVANPVAQGSNTTLDVPASDNLSGVVGGEYYIGSTDPGKGNGTSMMFNSSTDNLCASLGSSLTPGTYQVNVRAEDAAGNWSTITTTTLTINSTKPTVGAISAPATVAKATSFNATGTFTDPGVTGTFTAQWDWGDKTTPTTGTVTAPSGTTPGSVSGSHSYANPGSYIITLSVTNAAGLTATNTYTIAVSANSTNNFKGVNMTGLNYSDANLSSLDISGSNMQNGVFNGTNFTGSSLAGNNAPNASFQNANFTNANLSGSTFQSANFTGANFTGANLKGANFKSAIMTNVTWSNTVCPDGTNSNNDGGTCVGRGGGL